MRGEYKSRVWAHTYSKELPPRARRIRDGAPRVIVERGTTSACAENTAQKHVWSYRPGNYLRVRGEYHIPHCNTHHTLELPPRARRIPRLLGRHGDTHGTTSACAENTPTLDRCMQPLWNYLRVRGEYVAVEQKPLLDMELPPRARRILFAMGHYGDPAGTTSACAENTS